MQPVGLTSTLPLTALRFQAAGMARPERAEEFNDLVTRTLFSDEWRASPVPQKVKDLGFASAHAAYGLPPTIRQDMLNQALQVMTAGVPGSVGGTLARIARKALANPERTEREARQVATSVLFSARSQQEPGSADSAALALLSLWGNEKSRDNQQILQNALGTIALLEDRPGSHDLIGLLRAQAEGLDAPATRQAYNRLLIENFTGSVLQDAPLPSPVKTFARAASRAANGLPAEAQGNWARLALATMDGAGEIAVGSALAKVAVGTTARCRQEGYPLSPEEELHMNLSVLSSVRQQHEPETMSTASLALLSVRRDDGTGELNEVLRKAVETIAAGSSEPPGK